MSFVSLTPQKLSGALVLVDIGSIIYIQREKEFVVFRTIDGKSYYSMGTLKHWTYVFINTGFEFYICDRNSSVNINKIVGMNPLTKHAYFNSDQSPNRLKCTMSQSGYMDVSKLLRERQASVVFFQ